MAFKKEDLQQKTTKELNALLKVSGSVGQSQIKAEVKRRNTITTKRRTLIAKESSERFFGRLGPSSDLTDVRGILGFLGNSDDRTCFVIHGEPKAKERPRFGRGRAYSSKAQKDDEERLRTAMSALDIDTFTGTVAVVCIFYRSTQHRIDVDNLLKQVMDSGNGILWYDDDQVTTKVGILEIDRDHPRIVMGIQKYSCSVNRSNRAP